MSLNQINYKKWFGVFHKQKKPPELAFFKRLAAADSNICCIATYLVKAPRADLDRSFGESPGS